jgi:hypothetical protein
MSDLSYNRSDIVSSARRSYIPQTRNNPYIAPTTTGGEYGANPRNNPYSASNQRDNPYTIAELQGMGRDDLLSRIENEYELAKQAEIELPDEQNQKKKFKVWDVLEWVRYPITNMIYKAVEEGQGDGLGFDDFGKIIKAGVAGAMLTDKKHTEDVLRLAFKDQPEWVYKVGGLVGDILTDPLTYVSFGAAGGAKAAAAGKKAAGELIEASTKKIIQEGVTGKTAKALMKKFGGKTWKEALQRASKQTAKDVSNYGLNVGIPFTNISKQIAKGGRADVLANVLGKVGASDEVVQGARYIGTTIGNTKVAKALKNSFNTSGKYDVFETAVDVERAVRDRASLRAEKYINDALHINDKIDDVIKAHDSGAFQFPSEVEKAYKAFKRPNDKRSAIFESVRTLRDNGLEIPDVLKPIDEEISKVMDNIWGDMVKKGIVDDAKKLEDYFPRFYINKKTGNTALVQKIKKNPLDGSILKTRQFETLAEARAAGFEPAGAYRSLQLYIDKANRLVKSHDLLNSMVKKYGVKIAKDADAPAGFVKLSSKAWKGHVVPEEIANVLNAADTILTETTVANKLAEYINKVHGMWKKQATIYRPGFHLRNAQSNLFTAIFKDGFGARQLKNMGNASEIYNYGRLLRHNPDKASQLGNKVITILSNGKPKKSSIKTLYEAVRKNGIHTGTFGMADLYQSTDVVNAFQRAEKGIFKTIERGAEGAGSYIENVSRIASALNDVGKGLSMNDAASRVKKYFLDYADVTKMEEGIRRFMPFYTWMRKNLANQIEFALANPGRYTAFTSKPLRAIDQLSEEYKRYMPEWMEEQMQINPFGIETKDGKPLMMNTSMPFTDLNKIDLSNPLGSLGSMALEGLTPLVKTPAELLLNKSQFTDRPIAYNEYSTREAPVAMEPVFLAMPRQMRERLNIYKDEHGRWQAPSKWVYALTTLVPLIGYGDNIAKAARGNGPDYQVEQAPYKALSQFGGISLRPYDTQYYQEQYLREQLNSLQTLRRGRTRARAGNE